VPWQRCETVQNVLLIPLSAGLRFFTVSRLALNPNLIFKRGSRKEKPVVDVHTPQWQKYISEGRRQAGNRRSGQHDTDAHKRDSDLWS